MGSTQLGCRLYQKQSFFNQVIAMYGLLAYFSPVSQVIILHSFFYQKKNKNQLLILYYVIFSTSALSWMMTYSTWKI